MVEIYGTLGPACAGREILEQMFQAGLTGMRLNLSHTGLEESAGLVENFRQAAKNTGVEPQLLIDMQGPELRIGKLAEEVHLQKDAQVILTDDEGVFRGGAEHSNNSDTIPKNTVLIQDVIIPVQAEVLAALEAGDEVLLNDGRIAILVLEKTCESAKAIVVRGGALSSHKSIKIIGKQADLPVLTEHDITNICLAKEYGVTGLMQPFVKDGEELAQVREVLRARGAEDIKIFAKIENRPAVENLDSILKEADVLIIARGDLGNDMELWELPAVQKDIEKACIQAGKPFIVVTQMLASMEASPVPTRAEVSDIFNAVADGAYGVMITGESAVGKYPVEAVKYLANTARSATEWLVRRSSF